MTRRPPAAAVPLARLLRPGPLVAFGSLGLACAVATVRAGSPAMPDRMHAYDLPPESGSPVRSDLPRPVDPARQLSVVTTVRGHGPPARKGDRLRVRYSGGLPGAGPSANLGDAAPPGGVASFVLGAGEVMPGWDEGLVGIKEGEKRKLVIPAAMAYGREGAGGTIPQAASLTYEVELLAPPGEGHED